MRVLYGLVALTFASWAGMATAATCPADLRLAVLVAHAPYILTGAPQVTPDQVAAVKEDYLDMPVRDIAWIKGGPSPAPVVVRSYIADDNVPTKADLDDAAGRPSLMFLVRPESDVQQRFYFAGNDSLQPITPDNVDAARSEIARQATVLAAWQPDTALPHYAEVQQLITQLAAIRTLDKDAYDRQQAVFAKLEALGMDAVPAIIAQMDDRRKLADPAMALVNTSPDAFEPQRLYGPDTIVDALAAVLNQITWDSFNFIYNGGSDRERDEAVAGWRIYASMLRCPGVAKP